MIKAIITVEFVHRVHSSPEEFWTAKANQFSNNIILVKHTFFPTNFVLGMHDLNVLRNTPSLPLLILFRLPSGFLYIKLF